MPKTQANKLLKSTSIRYENEFKVGFLSTVYIFQRARPENRQHQSHKSYSRSETYSKSKAQFDNMVYPGSVSSQNSHSPRCRVPPISVHFDWVVILIEMSFQWAGVIPHLESPTQSQIPPPLGCKPRPSLHQSCCRQRAQKPNGALYSVFPVNRMGDASSESVYFYGSALG